MVKESNRKEEHGDNDIDKNADRMIERDGITSQLPVPTITIIVGNSPKVPRGKIRHQCRMPCDRHRMLHQH